MNRLCVLGALLVVMVGLVGLPPMSAIQAQSTGSRMATFEDVARQSGVPLPILIGLAWEQSGLTDHGGRPSIDGGYGLMDLSARPEHDTLGAASRLLHRSAWDIRHNDRLNLLGGALLLQRYWREETRPGMEAPRSRPGMEAPGYGGSRGMSRFGLGAWSAAIVRFTGMRSAFAARLLLNDLYGRLRLGIHVAGLSVAPIPAARPDLASLHGLIAPIRSHQTGSAGADYPGAVWEPANPNNYTDAKRPSGHHIRFIVIHDTESSCAAAVNWFQDPTAQASANYVICQDGTVIQTVPEHDIAWHAGNWPINQESIGIEHEGYASGAYYTRVQYLASAALVHYLCHKYGIDPNRDTIFGHENVPAATHTDPGPNWNWSFYMERVRHDTTGYTGGSVAVLTATAGDLVRACPHSACAVLGSANWGEQFAVIAQQPGWEQVDYAGQPGWVADSGVAGGSGYVVQTTAATVLRDGPHLTANAIVTVPAGQRYVSMVQDGRWWYVAYNHRYGFLPASALRVSDCLVGHLAGCVATTSAIVAVPNTASPGSTITVASGGAPPSVALALTLEGIALGSYQTDSAGRFAAQVTLPLTLTPGAQTLSALGDGIGLGTRLRVRAAPSFQPQLTLSQTNLSPGQGITINGTGFRGLQAVDLTLALPRTDGSTKHLLIHTFSQPTGTLAPVHVTLPANALPGSYAMTARAPGVTSQASMTIEGESAIGTPGTPAPTTTPTPSPTPTG